MIFEEEVKMNEEIINEKIRKHSRSIKELEYEVSRKEDYYTFLKLSEYELINHLDLINFHINEINRLDKLIDKVILKNVDITHCKK